MGNRNILIKLGAMASYAVIVYTMYLMNVQCIFIRLFGVRCLGCGMTRAWLAALKGHFCDAFAFHPMFWSVPIIGLFILTDGKVFKSSFLNKAVLVLLGVGYISVFLLRVFGAC